MKNYVLKTNEQKRGFTVQKLKNPALQTILEHRSIRKFKPRRVSSRLINLIVEAGQRAPSACGMQAYSLILVTESDLRQQVLEAIGLQRCME